MIQKIKNNKLLVLISVLLLIVIIIITSKIILNKELIIDKIAHDILVKKLRNPTLTEIMKWITKLSNTTFIVLATIFIMVLLISKKKEKIAALVFLNLGAITLMNQVLKYIFKRERPIGYKLIRQGGYSFPSGHAMVSMAFYGLIIYLIIHLVKNNRIKKILITMNIIIILLIGISRIYLGVHYLSDILTGYSISMIYLFILTHELDKKKFIT